MSMFETLVGNFKKKSDYKEAAKLAMVRAVLRGKTKRLKMIKAEYQQYFGFIEIVQHSWDVCSISELRCHHVDYISLEDCD